MNNDERMKEIEKKAIGSTETSYPELYLSKEDLQWLLTRVKSLTATLQEIVGLDPEQRACLYLDAEEIACKALATGEGVDFSGAEQLTGKDLEKFKKAQYEAAKQHKCEYAAGNGDPICKHCGVHKTGFTTGEEK